MLSAPLAAFAAQLPAVAHRPWAVVVAARELALA